MKSYKLKKIKFFESIYKNVKMERASIKFCDIEIEKTKHSPM